MALTLPIDVLPDLNRPTVTILTESHGMVPEDVERLVTRPIELAVTGATGVTRVRSSSGLGLSLVFVEFGWETEIFRNRQVVQEKLAGLPGRLPPDIKPEMAPIASIMGQILQVGLRSRSGGTDVSALERLETPKGIWLVHRGTEPGARTISHLPAVVQGALDALPGFWRGSCGPSKT